MLLLFCRTRLQMELDSKESDIELLMSKNALNNSDTTSVHSGNDLDAGAGSGDELLGQCLCNVTRSYVTRCVVTGTSV